MFSHMRHLATKCLVSQQATPGRATEITRHLGQQKEATMPTQAARYFSTLVTVVDKETRVYWGRLQKSAPTSSLHYTLAGTEVPMKRSYCPQPCGALSSVLVGLVLLCALSASAQAPSIEGTYRLVSRKTPDGTMLRPPDIMGLFTYTKTHRNFNIAQKDAAGKFRSFSLVSTYTLTATEYTETLLYSIRTEQIGGKEPIYDVSGQTGRAPVTVEGGRIQFKSPFDPPSFVFEGNTLTATLDGRVDVWEKVP
jgi:hypothetical protein